MTTQKLPENFQGIGEVSNFQFQRVEETDQAYIYKVFNNQSKHYEVFKKKTSRICLDFEKKIYDDSQHKEVYPRSANFGKWAFTAGTKETAYTILKRIENDTRTV